MDFFKKPKALPKAHNLHLSPVNDFLTQFTSQSAQFPALDEFSDSLNSMRREDLYANDANLEGNLQRFSDTTSSFLRGEIPQDVQDQISRSAAFSALRGGYGAGSGMNRNLVGRDLGLTSLDIMQRGASQLPQELTYQQQLNPFQAGQFLFSPQTIQQRGDQQTMYNTNVSDTNAQIAYANSLRKSPWDSLLDNTFSHIISSPFNLVSNAADLVAQAPNIAAKAVLSYVGGPGAGAAVPMGTNVAQNMDGGFGSYAGAQSAAPYAGGISQTPWGFVPQAAPASAPNSPGGGTAGGGLFGGLFG